MEKRLIVKLGNMCNNNCLYCYQAKEQQGFRRADICKSLSEIEGRFDKVILTGGEPTIYPDIKEMISLAKRFSDVVYLQTNARMLSDKVMLGGLKSAGVTGFLASVCSDEAKIHDLLTQVPGSFRQTLNGFKNISEEGMYLLINIPVVKQNLVSLPHMPGMLKRFNPSQIQFSLMYPEGNALKNIDSTIPSISAARPYISDAVKTSKQAGLQVRTELVPFCMLDDDVFAERTQPDILVIDHTRIYHHMDEQEKMMVKPGSCEGCRHIEDCPGVSIPYLERFGDKGLEAVR